MLFRRPLHEVAAWPASDVNLLEHYLAKQPAPEERTEIAVATLCTMYRNAHRADGEPPHEVVKFLPYLDPWSQPIVSASRYSEVDRSLMAAFGMRLQ